MDNIDVVMTAWPNHPKRLEYFRRTVEGLRKYLTASRHLLRFFCSAESEPDPARPFHGAEFEDICDDYDINLHWRDAPADLGGNLNAAFALSDSDYRFLCQDDWQLTRPLDLSPAAEWLDAHPEFIMYRYYCRGCHFLELDGAAVVDMSDSTWPYGDNPGLWHWPRFNAALGPFKEGVRFGKAEGQKMLKAKAIKAKIAASPNHLVGGDKGRIEFFRHLGQVTSVVNDWRNRNKKFDR